MGGDNHLVRSKMIVVQPATLLDAVHKGAIHHVLAFNGGIAPVAQRRGPAVLEFGEREEILFGVAASRSIRSIAVSLMLFVP